MFIPHALNTLNTLCKIFFFAALILTTSARHLASASAVHGCNQGNISSLSPWQQALMQDFKVTSVFGRMCFDTNQV
jgi:hypothetical protein